MWINHGHQWITVALLVVWGHSSRAGTLRSSCTFTQELLSPILNVRHRQWQWQSLGMASHCRLETPVRAIVSHICQRQPARGRHRASGLIPCCLLANMIKFLFSSNRPLFSKWDLLSPNPGPLQVTACLSFRATLAQIGIFYCTIWSIGGSGIINAGVVCLGARKMQRFT